MDFALSRSMKWNGKRARAAAGSVWIGLVILACSNPDETTVSGEVTRGGCPPGAECSPPSSAGPVFFRASRVIGVDAPEGELPPVANGGYARFELVRERSGGFDPYVRVPGHRIEAEGMEEVADARPPTWFLAAASGTFTVRALDADGLLIEQAQVRVERARSVRMEPRFGPAGFHFPLRELGPWRVWQSAGPIPFAREAFSETGEPLVALAEPGQSALETHQAPDSGPLELPAAIGRHSSTTRFEPARRIDGVRVGIPHTCIFLAEADFYACLFGTEAGATVLGAPLAVEDEMLDPAFPCVGLLDEPTELEVVAGDESWTVNLPARGTRCQ